MTINQRVFSLLIAFLLLVAVPSAFVQAQPIRFGVSASVNKGGGILVVDTIAGLAGEKAGLKKGDVILEIDGKKLATLQNYSDAVDAAKETMRMTVQRAGASEAVTLTARLVASTSDHTLEKKPTPPTPQEQVELKKRANEFFQPGARYLGTWKKEKTEDAPELSGKIALLCGEDFTGILFDPALPKTIVPFSLKQTPLSGAFPFVGRLHNTDSETLLREAAKTNTGFSTCKMLAEGKGVLELGFDGKNVVGRKDVVYLLEFVPSQQPIVRCHCEACCVCRCECLIVGCKRCIAKHGATCGGRPEDCACHTPPPPKCECTACCKCTCQCPIENCKDCVAKQAWRDLRRNGSGL